MKTLRIAVLTLAVFSGVVMAGGFGFKPYEQLKPLYNGMPVDVAEVAVGDITGDGRDDLIAFASDNQIFVYRQQADGVLSAPMAFSYGNSIYRHPKSMLLADVNNDRILDVVTTTIQGEYNWHSGFNVISLNASGQLSFSQTPPDEDRSMFGLSALDVDLDGNIDIVGYQNVTDYSGGLECGIYSSNTCPRYKIHYGDGKGGFPRIETVKIGRPETIYELSAVDMDGDGFKDLAASLIHSAFVSTYTLRIQKHDRVSSLGQALYFPLLDGSSVRYGDFNGDGRKDFLVARGGTTIDDSYARLYLQGADGQFDGSSIRQTYVNAAPLVSDLDRDGFDDLFVSSTGWNWASYHIQRNGLLQEPVGMQLADLAYERSAAAGDLDSDGCSDIAQARGTNGLLLFPGQGCDGPLTAFNQHNGDFDGNGKADILWRNPASGQNRIWKDGNPLDYRDLVSVAGTGWQIVGIGDFDGDGKSDILWRDALSGRNAIWLEGSASRASNLATVTVAAWQVAGIGDFDGDGRSDIQWRHKFSGANAIWKSGDYTTQLPMPSINLDWRIAGVGDFNGDHKADILWRNKADGRNAIWNSADPFAARNLATVADSDWQVTGIGDFDGDHSADILWRHAPTGRNAIWKRGDAAHQQTVASLPGSRSKIAAIGDFDGNGAADLLWRNSNGANSIWRDADSAASQAVLSVESLKWQIVR